MAQQVTPDRVRVLDESGPGDRVAQATTQQFYARASDIPEPLDVRYTRDVGRFVPAVLDEVAPDQHDSDARLLDELDCQKNPDVDLAVLLAFPDESLLFLGSDPTAKDAIPLFAYHIPPGSPIPPPTTADEALDLLRPPAVQDAFYADGYLPTRQGEWWLLPTQLVPAGSLFNPGVDRRPYGPSPLGNHVPREYGFAVSDSVFMNRFAARVPDAPTSITTPPEALRWTHRQLQKAHPQESVPEWADIREMAEEILVKGTLRHREDDHYLESIGDVWHTAKTHQMDVYTGDDMIEEVRLD